ncbi:glycoside hydrolase family 30 protein [Rhypophila decipiens]
MGPSRSGIPPPANACKRLKGIAARFSQLPSPQMTSGWYQERKATSLRVQTFAGINHTVQALLCKKRQTSRILLTAGKGQFWIGVLTRKWPNSTKDWMYTHLPSSPGSPEAMAAGNATYVWDGKDSGQLWVSQQAVKYGVKTFYGNAWSAPGFMKTNGRDSGGGWLCGVPGANCSSGDWRQAYADYLVKYIEFYEQSGVNVSHIGFLNEPDYSANYASMLSTGAQSASFIKVLHSTLEKSRYSHVQIACCNATGWNAQQAMTSDLVAAGVEDLLGVITSHPYTSPITNFTQPTRLKVWETETSDLSGKWSTKWYSTASGAVTTGDGYTWANLIHDGLTAGNISAYLWWVGTQDAQTNGNNNEKLILVDGGDYVVSKRFWAFAHYSRTIRPGAVRLGVSSAGTANLRTTAFENVDGSVVANIINTKPKPAALQVVIAEREDVGGEVRAWVTDENNDMTELVDEIVSVVPDGNTVGGVTVPGKGIVSILVKKVDW